jgi:hypothetical protein
MDGWLVGWFGSWRRMDELDGCWGVGHRWRGRIKGGAHNERLYCTKSQHNTSTEHWLHEPCKAWEEGPKVSRYLKYTSLPLFSSPARRAKPGPAVHCAGPRLPFVSFLPVLPYNASHLTWALWKKHARNSTVVKS